MLRFPLPDYLGSVKVQGTLPTVRLVVRVTLLKMMEVWAPLTYLFTRYMGGSPLFRKVRREVLVPVVLVPS